jgi:dipeptidyl aminopeptidase/acylaminoacyl peptidase
MLVVHGDQDDIVPVSEAYFAEKINPKHVALFIVDDGDHMFSRAEHQERVGRQVADWFRRQSG